MNLPGLLITFIVSLCSAIATQPTTSPVGSVDNPKQITSKDRGPDIDPAKVTASPYRALPFRTFRSFMSGAYAVGDVWVYAANDDATLYDTELHYPFPRFYRPTWGEVFDHVARQMKARWSWNPENRQFKFERSDTPPFFGVTLADGWRSEDRGDYVWHAPKDQDFGMDIYYFGHYTPSADQPDLHEKVRVALAERMVAAWPDAPKAAQMSTVKIGDAEALHLKIDTPRPGGVWRQWSVVIDGHAFVIVSAMPKENEAPLVSAVEKMVASFKLTK